VTTAAHIPAFRPIAHASCIESWVASADCGSCLCEGHVIPLTVEWDNFPAWSPHGDRIAFTGFRTGDFEIFTITPNGTGLRQVTRDRGTNGHPVWSPDGRSLLFTSSRVGWKDEVILTAQGAQMYGELFAMRADGTGMRQLTDNRWEEAPSAWLLPVQTRNATRQH
jgi:dipeptidyl aminopeptidase/acylaminoacyl peptidase